MNNCMPETSAEEIKYEYITLPAKNKKEAIHLIIWGTSMNNATEIGKPGKRRPRSKNILVLEI